MYLFGFKYFTIKKDTEQAILMRILYVINRKFYFRFFYPVIFNDLISSSLNSKWYFKINGLPGNVPEISADKT